jgi:hypothetical protein
MPDASSHVATRRDDVHTIPLAELEATILKAGIVMSRRQITRHCKSGTFDAIKLPAANNVENWYIAPSSVEKSVADIKALRALRDSHVETRRDVSGNVTPKEPLAANPDTSRHDASRPDMSQEELGRANGETRSDTSRHVDELDIFEHPYVKRLENQVEKWEGKYQEQVRRTEEIQMKSTQQILELQRMTAIGQSETLADFMLKAKEWVLGPSTGSAEKTGTTETPAA